MNFTIGQPVHIVPIDESGTVINIRKDDRGVSIYDVLWEDESAIHRHVCRESELTA